MIRGPISMLIVGSITLVIFLLVSLGPRAFERFLPEPIMAALEGGMIFSTSQGVSGDGDSPDDFLADSTDGLKARGPIAAREGNHAVYIDDVISGYRTRIGSDAPAEVTTIRPITGCKLTLPQEGTRIGHVTAGQSGLVLPMSTYNDSHLAAAVQTFVNSYRDGSPGLASEARGPSYEAYDVAVTETRAPVYLVLVNGYGNRIWNIHLAEGARIERVVLLGGDQAGVANLDPVVPVEVILEEGLAECGIRPFYGLNPGHQFFEALNNGPESYKAEGEAKLAVMNEATAAYDIWFRDSFGVTAQDTRAGFDAGTISVVGPVPGEADPKAAYASIQGGRIRTTQDTYFEISGQVPEGEDFASRVKAIATAFAFGDLAYLRQGAKF
ncbi:MAG: hypothetical protein JNK19_03990 [Tabrizicola sp.]|nr:hypothetical protein [Tabrizicola sp.]